jgi:hypothetical protein
LKRDDLVKVLTNPDTEDVDMGFPEQSIKVLTNPDTSLFKDSKAQHVKLLDLSWVIFPSGYGCAPSG